MSCNNDNPCGTPDCGCAESNPCYENCGCLHPTTFECITKPGAHSNLGVVNTMNGAQVLTQLDLVIAEIKEDIENIDETGTTAPDTKVSISSDDNTSGFLYDKTQNGTYVKRSIVNAGAAEKLRFDIALADLVSSDSDNELTLGTDNKLKVAELADNKTYISEGSGIEITGAGTVDDPKIISTSTAIQVARPCFDGVWRNIILSPTGNGNVVYSAGTPKYRYRYDGTIELKGNVTYIVSFGAYTTGDRKQTAIVGPLSTTCVSAVEQNGQADLKGINYIDTPQASADQIVQQYGYIIKKNAQNISIDFQSSFSASTSKTIVVSFDGVVIHPNF